MHALTRNRIGRAGTHRAIWIDLVAATVFVTALVSGGATPANADPATETLQRESLQRFESVQIRMGVPVRILVYAEHSGIANQAMQAAFDRIRAIDRSLSDYDPDSEVNRLCRRHPPGEPFPCSDDLWAVLKASKLEFQRSGGLFDVTIGPVTRLWRVARRKHQLPPEDQLKSALDAVGDRYLTLNDDQKTVTLLRAGMQLDFGGIAKGYAADEAFRILKEQGISIALIAVAGDIRVGDAPPGKMGWNVEVEDKTLPPGPDRKPLVLSLVNQAISTSGDTYQYLELDGVRYSHIVDPRTGIGLTTPCSVTVIAPTGMQADAMASMITLLGPEEGMKLVEAIPQTSFLMVRLEEGQSRIVIQSPGWPGSR